MRKTVYLFNGLVFHIVSALTIAAALAAAATICPAQAPDAGDNLLADDDSGSIPAPPEPVPPTAEEEKDPMDMMAPADAAPATGAGDGGATGDQAGGIGSVASAGKDTISLSAQDMDVRYVLAAIDGQLPKVSIIPSMNVTGTVTLEIPGISPENALKALKHAAALEYERKDNIIFVYTKEEFEAMMAALKKPMTRIFRLSYMKAKDAQTIIKESSLLSEIGKVGVTPEADQNLESYTSLSADEGGGGGEKYATGGDKYAEKEVLVITDYEENLLEIARVLDKLDIRPREVLIECTILRARLNDDAGLGVNLTAIHGTGNTSGSTVGLMSGSLTEPTTNNLFDKTQVFDNNIGAGVVGAATDVTRFGSMTLGVIAENIVAFVRAAEAITDITITANPKMVVLNKMQGSIHVGEKIGYVASTTTTSTSSTQEVEFLNVGTILLVRPYICKDGFIRLELQPKDSTGRLDTFGTAVLPNERVTMVTTNMMVRDGHTLVIGGLFRENTQRDRGQVPLLGDIPVFGQLFRGKTDQHEREEVIVLITPHVVRHRDDEIISKELEGRVRRFRLGARKGMYWWSHTRLADRSMLRARRQLAGGNVDAAIWYLDMAVAFEPTRAEAIDLRNRLQPKASWVSPPEHIDTRELVNNMIHADESLIPTAVPPNGAAEHAEGTRAYVEEIRAKRQKKQKLLMEGESLLKPGEEVVAPPAGPGPEPVEDDGERVEKADADAVAAAREGGPVTSFVRAIAGEPAADGAEDGTAPEQDGDAPVPGLDETVPSPPAVDDGSAKKAVEDAAGAADKAAEETEDAAEEEKKKTGDAADDGDPFGKAEAPDPPPVLTPETSALPEPAVIEEEDAVSAAAAGDKEEFYFVLD